MPTGAKARTDRALIVGAALTVVAPVLTIAAIVAWRSWRVLAGPDRLLVIGCAAALATAGFAAHRMRMRDTVARHILIQAPMAVGLYAFTHDPLSPAIYLCSSLSIYGLIRWAGPRQ